MTSTHRHDGVVPDLPEPRAGTVVVGVSDDVKGSEPALWDAVQWASRRQVDLKLVMALPGGDHSAGDRAADERRRRALHLINVAAHSAALHADVGLRVHTAVAVGAPAETLVAESQTAGLIVVQRRDRSAWSRIRKGSITADVAGQAHCPVLVVHAADRSPEPHQARDVMVAVDWEGHAGRAIQEAFVEASWRGVGLTAVHVRHADRHRQATPADQRLVPEIDKDLAEQLAGVAADHPEVPVRRLVTQAEVAPGLLEAAREHDLVVIARHGGDRRGDSNLGSVTRHVLAGARCPVLITAPSRPTRSTGAV